jgi:CRISPR-associated protein Cas2
MERLHVIVTYDISQDKARHKVSECCQDYGLDRTQYSVFSGELKPIHIRALAKQLGSLIEEGHILIIPISRDDWERRQEIGQEIIHEQ